MEMKKIMIYILMYLGWILALLAVIMAMMKKYKITVILIVVVLLICTQFQEYANTEAADCEPVIRKYREMRGLKKVIKGYKIKRNL